MTPFNLKEEMSSGKFDSNGFYINNKEEDITDNWMEDVDWVGCLLKVNFLVRF